MNLEHWHYFKQPDEQLTRLLDTWQQNYPEGGFVAFVAESNLNIVNTLQKEFRSRNVALAGAVFPRLIVASGIRETGVLLYAYSTMPAFILIEGLDAGRPLKEMTDAFLGLVDSQRNKLLMMYFDGYLPDIASRVEECHLQFADQVAYAGANAGGEGFEQLPCLFDQNRFESNGMLAMLLPYTDGPYIEHGFSLPDTLLPVTSSTRNCVETINWRPAFDVYRELALTEYHTKISKKNFYRLGVCFPFGIVRSSDVVVRIPVDLADDNSLICFGEVPDYSLLALLESNIEDLMRGVLQLSDAVNESGSSFGMTFYCAGREMFLGREGTVKEIEVLGQKVGEVYGAVSLGEIGSYRNEGYPVLQNATVLFCPFREDE